ncbi:MAG: hypothetical protein ACTII7_11845 [Galactobacter sp.]
MTATPEGPKRPSGKRKALAELIVKLLLVARAVSGIIKDWTS